MKSPSTIIIPVIITFVIAGFCTMRNVFGAKPLFKEEKIAFKELTPELLNVCNLCKGPIKKGLTPLPCGHVFHKICLKLWIAHKQKKRCPIADCYQEIEVCVICAHALFDDEGIITLPCCKHRIHKKCSTKCLQHFIECPYKNAQLLQQIVAIYTQGL